MLNLLNFNILCIIGSCIEEQLYNYLVPKQWL